MQGPHFSRGESSATILTYSGAHGNQNYDDCVAVGEEYRKCFGSDGKEVGAAATMLVIKDGFADRDMLVEVEVEAVVEL